MKAKIIECQAILKTVELYLNNEKYYVSFSLNVIKQIQQEFGSMDDLLEEINDNNIDAIIRVFEILINDSIDRERIFEKKERDYIDVRVISYLIGTSNLNYYTQVLQEALGISLPDAEEQEETDDAQADEETFPHSGQRQQHPYVPCHVG